MGIPFGHNALYTKHLGDKYSCVILFLLGRERLRLGSKAEGPENINQYVTLIYVLSVSVCAGGLLVTLIPAQCPCEAGDARPSGRRREQGSQILLLIDTWVNIIPGRRRRKKDQCWVFLSRSRTDREGN